MNQIASLRLRFGTFEFDPATGEVFRRREDSTELHTRLPPQPARLLAHLIERRPEIVGSEEIRELLWPAVQVEFEPSLHFCIRQIRLALSDSAATPEYIETIPRRGYRFIAEVVAVPIRRDAVAAFVKTDEAPVPIPVPTVEREPERGARPGKLKWALLVLATVVLAGGLFFFIPDDASPGDELAGARGRPRLRVAIMSFEPIDGASGRPISNDIAEELISRLVSRMDEQLEVVGPTTTLRYETGPDGLSRLIEDYRIDFVVNGRLIGRDEGTGMLGEVIRASDGAHVWVGTFPEFSIARETAAAIAEGLTEAVAAANRQ